MIGRKLFVTVLAVIASLAVGCASARRPQFQLDWQVSQGPGGPSVKGHVMNASLLPARDLRLLVEGLDGPGTVQTTTLGVLPIIIPSRGSVPFDIPVPGTAASYRVSVLSFTWVLPPASPGRSR